MIAAALAEAEAESAARSARLARLSVLRPSRPASVPVPVPVPASLPRIVKVRPLWAELEAREAADVSVRRTRPPAFVEEEDVFGTTFEPEDFPKKGVVASAD